MAKREITATSSPVEVRTAYEQLAKAQQEYREALNALKNDQGIPVVPSTGKPLTAQQELNLANGIASKYDYVTVGGNLGSSETGYNIGGDTFTVKGLNNTSKVTLPPESKTIVNSDDAFPATQPRDTVVTPNTNPKTNNPNQPKTDQSIFNERAPESATASPQVTTSTSNSTIGNKDATEAGAALESNNKNNPQNQTGIVNQNPNELPTTNNLPGRLSDEYLKEPAVSDGKKSGNTDDAASIARPMGTAIGGFVDVDAVNSFPDLGRSGGSGVVTSGTRSSIPTSTNAGTANNPNVPIRSNILHNYANWTYKISFYALDINDYNSIVSSGNIPASARKYPIAVSGGYTRSNEANNLARDIYIDSLRFTSIIGNRLEGKATNNIELELQLVEPYSANFMGELALLAQEINKQESTLGETPYLLEIDFTGYTDSGEIVSSILKDGKKYIPVKIITADMKIDAAGARYTFGLVPYSFYMFTQKKIALPKDVWVYGEAVDEILGENSTGLIGRLNNIEKEKVNKDKIQEIEDVYKIKYYSFDKKGSSTDQLAKSIVAFPTQGGPATIIKNRKIDENKPTKQGYTIKAGTLIKDVIKDLVLTSEYFNLKMNPNGESNKNNSNPAELIKIIPQVKLTEKWDKKRNEYAKEITYHVFNTLLFGEVFSHGGQALIGDWGYTKIYNYIFTGKNTDIIDLDVNFNLLYYTTFFTDKNELGLILTDMVADRASTGGNADPSGLSETTAIPGNVGKTSPNEPSRYINASLAAEFINLKMNNSNADMLLVDMTIIGDPDWIPQDSSVRGGDDISVGGFESKLDRWGSVAIDVAGVYAKLQLRTPIDYNDSNGMMDFVREDKSLVGGVYQVITVENNFQGGKFTSRLTMNKVPNQTENKKPRSSGSIANPTLPGNPR